jgi:predicted  nucleic acid-binding Zn-ribbon protein
MARTRRSRDELLRDPNYRDQSGGNRSRKIDGKTRKARGVDNRFKTDNRLHTIKIEIESNNRNIDKWRDRLEDINRQIIQENAENKRQQELKKAGKIKVASTSFAPDKNPAQRELSTALSRGSALERELRELKSRKF